MSIGSQYECCLCFVESVTNLAFAAGCACTPCPGLECDASTRAQRGCVAKSAHIWMGALASEAFGPHSHLLDNCGIWNSYSLSCESLVPSKPGGYLAIHQVHHKWQDHPWHLTGTYSAHQFPFLSFCFPKALLGIFKGIVGTLICVSLCIAVGRRRCTERPFSTEIGHLNGATRWWPFLDWVSRIWDLSAIFCMKI